MIKKRAFFCVLACLALLLSFAAGCYQSGTLGSSSTRVVSYGERSSGSYGADAQMPEPEKGPSSPRIARLPWEAWPLGRGLMGERLLNAELLRGDEYTKVGMRQPALGEYLRARKEKLSAGENQAAVLRTASTQLALDRPKEALRTLSAYFHGLERTPEEVDFRFVLVLAYAYGREGDIDQSFAWFSRLNRLSAGEGGEHEAALKGVSLLLRSLPDEKIYELGEKWRSDSFISTAIGYELKRRAGMPSGAAGGVTARKFWEETPESSGPAAPPGAVKGGVLGVVLPLSGAFAALGRRTRDGIALALEGQAEELGVEVVYKDDAGDAAQAAAAVRELAAGGSLQAVLGPLLADPAEAAGEAARENRVPLIALSKKSYFPTGGGVFRLGPTARSQVASLLDECYRKLGLVRYAVVFPDDEGGREQNAAFKQKAADLGVEVVYEQAYSSGDTAAFGRIGEELSRGRAEAVFLPDGPQAAARFVLSLPEGTRGRLKHLGSAKWDDQAQLMMSERALEGAIFVSPFFVKSRQPLIQQFAASYRYKYGQAPEFLAAQGFDAATLAVAALKRERAEGLDFGGALERIEIYQGLTGRIRVEPSGELARQFAVVRLAGGGLQELADLPQPSFVVRGDENIR